MVSRSDITFIRSLKAVHSVCGSRGLYTRIEASGSFRNEIDARPKSALAEAAGRCTNDHPGLSDVGL